MEKTFVSEFEVEETKTNYNDIPDYEMFASEESSQIDGEKLISLVKNNLGSKYVKYALHRHTFNRPSYLSCSPSTPQND